MKITNVTKHVSFIVETDNEGINIYRRNGPDDWEQQWDEVMWDESWEPLHECEEIEKLYQEYISSSLGDVKI
jgi:hypothetical protein